MVRLSFIIYYNRWIEHNAEVLKSVSELRKLKSDLKQLRPGLES